MEANQKNRPYPMCANAWEYCDGVECVFCIRFLFSFVHLFFFFYKIQAHIEDIMQIVEQIRREWEAARAREKANEWERGQAKLR